eukprot:1956623-Amphidinium_carterae.1
MMHRDSEERRKKLFQWLLWGYCRWLIGTLSTLLALTVEADSWPNQESSISLALNSVLHWMVMLYELRAFEATGQRLLPIMRSVQSILGMVVIMLFLTLAFVTAFWALDRQHADESLLFDVVVLLFTGESFFSAADFDGLDVPRKWVLILLTISGIFIFIACAMNVFIEVLGDAYDDEQLKMKCTFLQERARILSDLLLRPYSSKLQSLAACTDYSKESGICKYYPYLKHTPCFTFGLCFLVLLVSTVLNLTAWIPALMLTVWMVLMQTWLHSTLTSDWDSRYLWMCYRVGVEDSIAAIFEDTEETSQHGRSSRIRLYVRDQCKSVTRQLENAVVKRQQSTVQTTASVHSFGTGDQTFGPINTVCIKGSDTMQASRQLTKGHKLLDPMAPVHFVGKLLRR